MSNEVDLRKLRYFVAVAEHLHFGRAAEQLHIAQPVLSRQIRALEGELRARLFDRDRRGTTLTPAGEQLLSEAKPLLASAEALRRRVGRAARGERVFTVGFMPGLIVTETVRVMRERHPELRVEVVRTTWFDQVDVVHDGRVDVSYVRLPVDQRGLRLRPLFSEERVAVLPVGHALAGKEAVRVADLADDDLLQEACAVPEWRDAVIARRGEAPDPTRTPVFHAVEEKLEHVAAGRGIAILPLSVARFYTRRDLAHVTVEDIPPNQVCLAWDRSRRSPLIEEFRELAETIR